MRNNRQYNIRRMITIKKDLHIALALGLLTLAGGCRSLSTTPKPAAPAGSNTLAISAHQGTLIGKDGRSTVIGTPASTPVQANTATSIGRQMDHIAARLAVISGAKVDSFTDANGLKALRVSFDADVWFAAGQNTLTAPAQTALTDVAQVLTAYPHVNVIIFGHTDNVGTPEGNRHTSQAQAETVTHFLLTKSVPAAQITETGGRSFADPVADNATAEGRAQNRRIEMYLYAGTDMMKP